MELAQLAIYGVSFREPPKADIRRGRCDVRFVPKADIGHSLDHLVGFSRDLGWNG